MTATIHPLQPPLSPEAGETNWMHEAVSIGLKLSYLKRDSRELALTVQEHALRSGDAYYAQMATEFLELLSKRYDR